MTKYLNYIDKAYSPTEPTYETHLMNKVYN